MRALPALLVVAAVIIVAVYVADHPGNVDLTIAGWELQTSFGVAVLGVVLATLVLGLVGSGFAVQLIRSMLYGTRALDWLLFAEVGMLLALVAGVACAVPAWRASRLDPMQALRIE